MSFPQAPFQSSLVDAQTGRYNMLWVQWLQLVQSALNDQGSPNIDGGFPDSTYGGNAPINGGIIDGGGI